MTDGARDWATPAAGDDTRPLELSRGGLGEALFRLLGSTAGHAPRAAFLLTVIACLPMLVLAAAQGLATGDRVAVPLLNDLLFYARFVISIPFFVAVGPAIDRRVGFGVRSLLDSGIVPLERRGDFDRAQVELERDRDAIAADVVILAIAYASIWLVAGAITARFQGTWVSFGPMQITWAGWWLGLVALPLSMFLAGRWMWRFALWGRFMWRVSRLRLQLTPSHPDAVGGLGVLAETNRTLYLLVVPFSVVVSANAAHRIQYGGESPDGMQFVLAAYLILVALVLEGPMLVFSAPLARARFAGLLAYENLASHYSRSFDSKWLGRPAPAEPPGASPESVSGELLLGSPDIQSLADMGSGYAQVRAMRGTLTDPKQLLLLLALAIGPMLPFLATVVPLRPIVEKLLKLLLS